eukprot:TRINITY_DN22551_c0_g1_i11.p1 TRINITY_DN22551_c0_g1~~TRINITY_DN22551_c0_g1_i11.p1  ORF type:complete len:164 (-),score=28.62 TRINITY_DN22551_c0_g1_i11:347-838(-)
MEPNRDIGSTRSDEQVDAVYAKAADWFAISLDKTASAEQRSEFEVWLGDPEHAAAYRRVQQVWNEIGQYSGNSRIEELTRQALQETDEAVRWKWKALFASGLAVAVVLAGMWLGQYRGATSTRVWQGASRVPPSAADAVAHWAKFSGANFSVGQMNTASLCSR